MSPAARVLKNSVLRGAAGGNAAEALARGVEAAGQAGSTAGEFLRVRRDPAQIALRRRRAAIRRVNTWGLGSAVGAASTAALAVEAHGSAEVNATSVFTLVLVAVLTVWCLFGLARSVIDLRRRSRAVAALPPPQPARRAVSMQIKGEIGRLDGYSDGLRQLVSMLPLDAGSTVVELRRDVIRSADEAERRLRRQAAEFTAVHKALLGAPPAARPALTVTADSLVLGVRAGVDEFGQLVTAATDAVAASAELRRALADLAPPTDRLHSLAMGMREIADQVNPDRSADTG